MTRSLESPGSRGQAAVARRRVLRIGGPHATRAGRVFSAVTTGAALFIAGLQMYHVHGGILTNQGADLFGTAWIYALFRLGRMLHQRGRAMSAGRTAILVFVGCTTMEFGQKAHLVPGRYDPYDIVAYAVSVFACWVIDRWTPLVKPDSVPRAA